MFVATTFPSSRFRDEGNVPCAKTRDPSTSFALWLPPLADTIVDMRSEHATSPGLPLASTLRSSALNLRLADIFRRGGRRRVRLDVRALSHQARPAWVPIAVVLMAAVTLVGPIQGKPPLAEPETSDALKKRTIKKLETIIFPHIEFREQSLEEAIEFLRKKSVELDIAEPDPARRGVRIGIMKFGAAGSPERQSMDDTRITVSLTNIPLMEALRYATGLANMSFRVKPGLVMVVPQGLPLEIITREWKLTHALREAIPLPLKPGADISEWMISNDGRWPGPTLVVSRDGKRLIGKGTEDELELFDTIFKRATEPSHRNPGR